MEKKKKIMIGVIAALVLCLSFGGGYLLSKNGGVDELLEETGLTKNSKKNKDSGKGNTDKDDGVDAGAAGAGGDANSGDAGCCRFRLLPQSQHIQNLQLLRLRLPPHQHRRLCKCLLSPSLCFYLNYY